MEKSKIEEFRKLICSMSTDELQKKYDEIRDGISKMILDSDLVVEAAIVETALKDRKNV
jgi:hypothetical protein